MRKALLYLCLCLVGAFTAQTIAVLGYVDHVNGQRDRAEQRAAADRAAAGEQTRRIICNLAGGYARAFAENPPAPDSAGATVRDTWAALAAQFGCPPA
jgi:hypothetical protein